MSGRLESMAPGYLKGFVQGFDTQRVGTIQLSYSVIEGLSGSPVMTYHNGVKVVGMCYGSESQRVLAAEVVEVKDGEQHFRETVNRIVESGLAHHSGSLAAFLGDSGVEAAVTADSFETDTLD
jgi:hypothetical protein